MYKWFDRHIFHHVGRQIQNCAITTLIVDVIVCIIMAVFALDEGVGALGFLLIILFGISVILAFVYPIYGFGQLVEDIHRTAQISQGNPHDEDDLPEL